MNEEPRPALAVSDAASRVYRAEIRETAGDLGRRLFDCLWIGLDAVTGWTAQTTEVRFRVVLVEAGSGSGVGVAEARTRRGARKKLAETQSLLNEISADQARERFGLPE